MSANKPSLYKSWFCPYAQRAWIALLAKGVDFEEVEHDPYNKSEDWLKISPRGLIPVIVHNGRYWYYNLSLKYFRFLYKYYVIK